MADLTERSNFFNHLAAESSELADTAMIVFRQNPRSLPTRLRNDGIFVKGLLQPEARSDSQTF